MVWEKAGRLREGMRMMGLADSTWWVSWFISTICFQLVSFIGLCVCFSYLLEFTKAVYIPITLLFFIHTISFAFLLAAIFPQPLIGAIMSMLFYILSFMPYRVIIANATVLQSTSGDVLRLICMLPLTAFLGGMDIIFQGEKRGKSLDGPAAGYSVTGNGTFSLASVIMMQMISTVTFFFLAWYLDLVLPGKEGVRRPWQFIFSVWFEKPKPATGRGATEDENGGDASPAAPADRFEPVDDAVKRAAVDGAGTVSIRNIGKTFDTVDGLKTAVKDLSLDLYQNQITALLGHNGAGKTTLMSMLTG